MLSCVVCIRLVDVVIISYSTLLKCEDEVHKIGWYCILQWVVEVSKEPTYFLFLSFFFFFFSYLLPQCFVIVSVGK